MAKEERALLGHTKTGNNGNNPGNKVREKVLGTQTHTIFFNVSKKELKGLG